MYREYVVDIIVAKEHTLMLEYILQDVLLMIVLQQFSLACYGPWPLS